MAATRANVVAVVTFIVDRSPELDQVDEEERM